MSRQWPTRGVIKRGPLNDELHAQYLWWCQNKKPSKVKKAREWLRKRCALDPEFKKRRALQNRQHYWRKKKAAESCRNTGENVEQGIRVIGEHCGQQK